MSIHSILSEARNNGEILKIKYHGGSQPGTVRLISTISVSEDKVIARCLNSNTVKTFIIGKIELCRNNNHDDDIKWAPTKKSLVKYENLAAFCDLRRSELESLGWHVNSDANFVSLHRRFKNGKPLKGSDVSLHYEEFICDGFVDIDGRLREEHTRKHPRPWMVRTTGMHGGGYARLETATDVFMEQAKLLSPKNT
ncbi:MAG: hypothetical protein JXN61_03755 [Sedimentisphaerales bacterium]|nr:hypothetical protein [Sedimentisphaerales bacterium]